jgi:hypothetical protein
VVSFQKEVYSGLNPYIALWLVQKVATSLGRVFGKTQAPSRAAFYAWSATLEKILTLNNLRRRHVIVKDKCCMCKRNEKSVDHLLHCDVASAFLSVFFNRFGMSWIIPRCVIDLYDCRWSFGRPRSVAL